MKFESLNGEGMIQSVLVAAATYPTRIKDDSGKVIATDTVTPVEQKLY